MDDHIDISIVVPLYNEEESLQELTQWIAQVMEENNFSYEVVLVDDGSKDKSWQVVESITEKNNSVKVFSLEEITESRLHCLRDLML